MDKVHEELNEAKLEIERLNAECKAKEQLSENLMRELADKSDEICTTKLLYEELKRNIDDKESMLSHLSSTNERLGIECKEKLRKCDDENKQLLMAVEEATERGKNLEQKVCALTAETERLKSLLSVTEKKCSKAEEVAKTQKELRHRDDMFLELEDRRRKVEEQLKWKKEQFKHLEEAHEKLRDQFRASKREWEMEKWSLLEDIGKLQTSLDKQCKISEGLKSQLEMCRQALAHEENRRKHLDVQLSEMKSCLEHLSDESRVAKSDTECSSLEKDDEITALRKSLRIKEIDYKEMEFKARKLEEENKELLSSLKELQEAQIPKAATPPTSLAKLRNKLKSLEQTHKNCSVNLREKESEWNSRMDKMTQELTDYSFNLKIKDSVIGQLRKELDGCHSSLTQLKLQNEELSLMLQLLRSEYSEAQTTYANERAGLDSHKEEKDSRLAHLMEQLEVKNAALVKCQTDLEKEREQQFLMQQELQKCKEMLDKSSMNQLSLKEEAESMERRFKNQLQEVCDALDNVNSDLVEKTYEKGEIEFELQLWKSCAENLKVQLEEGHEMRKEVEASLLAQSEFEEILKQDVHSLNRMVEEKERRIKSLQQQITLLDQEVMKRQEESTPVNDFNDVDKAREKSGVDEQGPQRENVNLPHTPMAKTGAFTLDERSPFRELN